MKQSPPLTTHIRNDNRQKVCSRRNSNICTMSKWHYLRPLISPVLFREKPKLPVLLHSKRSDATSKVFEKHRKLNLLHSASISHYIILIRTTVLRVKLAAVIGNVVKKYHLSNRVTKDTKIS